MIKREELELAVAQKCGVSPEMSSIFFEVFVNRISNRLQPGDAIPFENLGYFERRHCRFQVEKPNDSQTGKSYLFTLVLFSEYQTIKDNYVSVLYFRIPDLKTLWKDDHEFLSSLRAGDFYPFTERGELIKSFATKAEVIISGLMKTYDKELEEELIIPYSEDLNFELEVKEKSTKHKSLSGTDQDSALPWGFGTKFMESKKEDSKETRENKSKEVVKKKELELEKPKLKKETSDNSDENKKKLDIDEALKSAIEESKIKDDHIFKPDFEPVKSRLSTPIRPEFHNNEQTNLRHGRKESFQNKSDTSKSEGKFTEVKSKTEAYHLQEDFKKLKKNNKIFDSKYSTQPPSINAPKRYYGNRNLIPIIVILTIIIILGAVFYIYFIKEDSVKLEPETVLLSVNPPPDVTVIDREYEFSVSYPYEKTEQNIPIEGISPEVFKGEEKNSEELTKKVEKPIVNKESETKKYSETKVTKEPEYKIIEKPIVTSEKTEKKESRIFFQNNYYYVRAGTFTSYSDADIAAEKYFNEGYNAVIIPVDAPGKPTRYILNVGDFTSEEFAKDFESKFLK